MAELHITEYQGVGQDSMGNEVQVAHGECGRHRLSLGSTPVSSAAVRGHYARLFATAPCRVAFGPEPTIEANSIPVAAEVAEFFYLPPGHKVAAVTRD